jgi:hypothetical protein
VVVSHVNALVKAHVQDKPMRLSRKNASATADSLLFVVNSSCDSNGEEVSLHISSLNPSCAEVLPDALLHLKGGYNFHLLHIALIAIAHRYIQGYSRIFACAVRIFYTNIY